MGEHLCHLKDEASSPETLPKERPSITTSRTMKIVFLLAVAAVFCQAAPTDVDDEHHRVERSPFIFNRGAVGGRAIGIVRAVPVYRFRTAGVANIAVVRGYRGDSSENSSEFSDRRGRPQPSKQARN